MAKITVTFGIPATVDGAYNAVTDKDALNKMNDAAQDAAAASSVLGGATPAGAMVSLMANEAAFGTASAALA